MDIYTKSEKISENDVICTVCNDQSSLLCQECC